MLNSVVLVGNTTKDIELKQTNSGVSYANFRLAVNRPFKNQKGEQETDFIDCTVWRGQAENAAKYVGKGSTIAVTGRLEISTYQNQKGDNVNAAQIVVDNLRYITTKEIGQQPQQTFNQAPQQQFGQPQQAFNQAPPQQFEQPQQTFNQAPQQQFEQPQQTFNQAPPQQFEQPQQTFNQAPPQQFEQPQQTFNQAPQQQFEQPQQTFNQATQQQFEQPQNPLQVGDNAIQVGDEELPF